MTTLTGTWSLVRLALRRDRFFLPVWLLSLVGTLYLSIRAVGATYDTPREVALYAATIGESPATVAMNGPATAVDTIGGILIYETTLTALAGTALMAVFTVVRHTRTEEEAGRTELLTSTVVGRHAPTAAAMLVAVGACLVVAAGLVASLVGEDIAVDGMLLYAAAVLGLGTVAAALACVAAQLTAHSRGAIGISLAALGVAYLLRAVGDVRDNLLSWLSPFGWAQHVDALAANRWWVLLLPLGLTVLLLVLAVRLDDRRDLGSGVVQPRPGAPVAGPRLGSAIGLAWRLQWVSLVAWIVGVLVWGVALGSLSQEMLTMVEENPTFADYFGVSGADMVDSFFGTALLLMCIGGAGFAVASALRTRSEEVAVRLEPVLATGVTRTRWLLSALAVTVAGSAAVVVCGGLGIGLGDALIGGGSAAPVRMAVSGLVYLPATLAMTALAVLLLGWAPRAVGLAWAMVAFCFVLSWLGGLLDLPGWVEALSPYEHTPTVPAEDLTPAPLVALTLVAVAGAAAGLTGFRRRDIG